MKSVKLYPGVLVFVDPVEKDRQGGGDTKADDEKKDDEEIEEEKDNERTTCAITVNPNGPAGKPVLEVRSFDLSASRGRRTPAVKWEERPPGHGMLSLEYEKKDFENDLNITALDLGAPSGQAAPLAALAPLVRQAQARWGAQGIDRVVVHHPGDAAARVLVVRGPAGRVTHRREFLLFHGGSGALMHASAPVGAPAAVLGGLYALHLGRFADPVLQAIYFLLGLAGTAMVGTGLVLWTAARGAGGAAGGVGRINVAVIAGLPLASAALLWANRLLPPNLPLRPEAELQTFFAAWALALAVAGLLRPARAWPLLWGAGALLFGALPVLNALTTQRPLWRSLASGDAIFVGMDVACAALALGLGAMAWRARRARERVAQHTREQERGA